MNFKQTFLFQITLGRPFTIQECINHEGCWCEKCGEDTNGIRFCGVCGERQSDKQEEKVVDIFAELLSR